MVVEEIVGVVHVHRLHSALEIQRPHRRQHIGCEVLLREYQSLSLGFRKIDIVVAQSGVTLQVLIHRLQDVVLNDVQQGRQQYEFPSVGVLCGTERHIHDIEEAVDSLRGPDPALDQAEEFDAGLALLGELSLHEHKEIVIRIALEVFIFVQGAELERGNGPHFLDYVTETGICHRIAGQHHLGGLLWEIGNLHLHCLDLGLPECRAGKQGCQSQG